MEVTDDVVSLRPWRTADASFLLEASDDPAIGRYNGPPPETLADAVSVIERIEAAWRSLELGGDRSGIAFAIVDAGSGEPVGMCGVDEWSSTDVVQFGYWLAAGARGRGLATRAVRLMTGWLFDAGAARVFPTIQSGNAPSGAVARRAGFRHEGTLRSPGVRHGERHDVEVFAVVRDEWPAPSAGEGGTAPDATPLPGPVYVVVSGPPASGKSTLAPQLAAHLGLPLVAKDTIKDALMSVLDVPDVEASRQLGRAAVRAMLAVADAVAGRRGDREQLLPEHRGSGPGCAAGAGRRGLLPVHPESAWKRYRSRAGTRHAGHFDRVRTRDELWNDEVAEPVAGPWPLLEVDTGSPVDVEAVVRFVRTSGGSR